MLKSGGEILINFLLINPLVELYKCMDEEWQKYIKVSSYLCCYYYYYFFLGFVLDNTTII